MISYLTYWLQILYQERSSREKHKVRDINKRMDIRLTSHHVSGVDPSWYWTFLLASRRRLSSRDDGTPIIPDMALNPVRIDPV